MLSILILIIFDGLIIYLVDFLKGVIMHNIIDKSGM